MSRFLASGKILALLMTLVVAGGIGYWAWSGLKAPPVAVPAAIVTTPPGWVKLDGGSFTLYAPEGAHLRQAQGAGFVYGDIVGSSLCVRFQAGSNVGLMLTKKSHPDFVESALTVDGHPGTLRRADLAPNEQQYWFPGCGQSQYAGLLMPNALPGGGTLVVEVSAENEDALADAMTMFKSIRAAK